MKRSPSFDSPGTQADSPDPVAEQLTHIEKLCNRLRMCCIPDIHSAKEALTAPSLVYEAQNLPLEVISTISLGALVVITSSMQHYSNSPPSVWLDIEAVFMPLQSLFSLVFSKDIVHR